MKRKPRPRQTTLREKIEKIKEKLSDINSDIFSENDDSDFEDLAKNFVEDEVVGTFETESRNLVKPKVVKRIIDFFEREPSGSGTSDDVSVDKPTNTSIDDFLLDASFDVGLSQMNDLDYHMFTRFDAGNEPRTGQSSPRRSANVDVDTTSYRDVIESDDSFEFGLSQMKEPDGSQTDDGCSPLKQQKVATTTTPPPTTTKAMTTTTTTAMAKTPKLSNKLSSKLSLAKNKFA